MYIRYIVDQWVFRALVNKCATIIFRPTARTLAFDGKHASGDARAGAWRVSTSLIQGLTPPTW